MSPPRTAALLFAALTTLYLLDGGFVTANGAKPNAWLPIAILEHHALSFAPDEEPFMFAWRDGRPREKYYLVPSVLPGRFVGTFGVGAGLVALPLFAIAHVVVGDLRAHLPTVWYLARLTAAACVAGSAALVFLAALLLTTRRRALWVALAYGLGSCAWSIAAEALYQHGPNLLMLALGALFFLRAAGDGEPAAQRRDARVAGLALGAAVACRPTSAVCLVACAVWLLWARRRLLTPFVLGAALPLALVAAYQWRWLGAPWATGQDVRAASVAEVKTGVADPWQTPLWLGAAGLLVSPSRGLLVFSPIFALGLAGGAVVLGRRRSPLVPLVVAAGIMMLIAFKWFDWWGGWTYGYRPIVDTMPLLALAMLPILDGALRTRWRRAACAAALAWSVAAQALGAFAYDTVGWNAPIVDGVVRDIDRPAFRPRLWSIGDSELVYYATHLGQARRARMEAVRQFVANPQD